MGPFVLMAHSFDPFLLIIFGFIVAIKMYEFTLKALGASCEMVNSSSIMENIRIQKLSSGARGL